MKKVMNDIKQPLISIIVPVYKVEKYLRRCLDSILSQIYRNIEIIIVDDGSPDMCGDICDEYNKLDYRIKVIHKKNAGLSDARNTALQMAQGEYICFVDSDDWVSPYYVEHLYEAISRGQADLGISWFEGVSERQTSHTKFEEKLLKYQCLNTEGCLKKLLYQDGVETCAWGKLYKRELFMGVRYPSGKLYEDIPVTYEAIKRSKKIAIIGNVDYYYFQREDSIQNVQFSNRKLDAIELCYNMLNSICLEYPYLKSAAECRYFSTVCNILFQIRDEDHEQEKEKLWKEVVKYRKSVMLNFQARKKDQIAALIAYMGYDVMNWIYGKTQKRGKTKEL